MAARYRGSRTALLMLSLAVCTLQRRLYFGAILPANDRYPFSIRTLTPVFEVANENIKRRQDLHNYTIEVTYMNSGPDVAQAPNSMYAIQLNATHNNRHVDAFFGPLLDEALAPVARQAHKWGIPVLTGGGVSVMFDDKRYFATLVRMGTVYIRDAFQVITYFMRRNNWSRAKLLTTRKVPNAVGMAHICDHLLTYTEGHQDILISTAYIRDDYKSMLIEEVGEEYAIVVLCAPPDVVRAIMATADHLMFKNGHYVFIVLDLYRTDDEIMRPWYRLNDSDIGSKAARESYRHVFLIGIPGHHSDDHDNILTQIEQKATQKYHSNITQDGTVYYYLAVFYDAIITFIEATYDVEYNQSRESIVHRILNNTYSGITGNIAFDDNGERITEYSVLQMVRDFANSGNFRIIANCWVHEGKYVVIHEEQWDAFDDGAPPDRPTCTYRNCGLDYFLFFEVTLIALAVLICAIVVLCFVYNRYKRSFALSTLKWRIIWDDVLIETVPTQRRFTVATSDFTGEVAYLPVLNTRRYSDSHRFTQVGFVDGTRVSIKFLQRDRFTIDRRAINEFKNFRDIENDHICKFIGACLDLPYQSIMTEYCQKGSLEDVLRNGHITLDWMIRFSLVHDIAEGMAFIHSTEFHSHGDLTSTNCLVDARFVLKITDFGLHFLRDHVSSSSVVEGYRRKLWTSPELMRLKSAPTKGTQHGDVYSFAIICQEVVYRLGVFHIKSAEYIPVKVKYNGVKKGVKPFVRPTLHSGDCPNDYFYELVTRSWSEEPEDRPSFHEILSVLQKINKLCKYGDIPDNLLQRMETYANDLESLVVHRTEELMDEKNRADELLHLLLPMTVATQLLKGEDVSAESYDSVTIFFSDIVGFTALSASCTPVDIIGLLHDLYTVFDSITDNFNVYKVETIGDAYMVVSGVPIRNGIQHAAEIAMMAITLLLEVKTFRIRFRPGTELQLRIGIHSGPVCTGVVGNKMPRYCLFGNTVTTAANYESSGVPLKIHISRETKELLTAIGGFHTPKRGEIKMQTRGRVTTYWLTPTRATLVSRDPSKHAIRNKQNQAFRRQTLTSTETSREESVIDANKRHATIRREKLVTSVESTVTLASFKKLQHKDSSQVVIGPASTDLDTYNLQKRFAYAWRKADNGRSPSVPTDYDIEIPTSKSDDSLFGRRKCSITPWSQSVRVKPTPFNKGETKDSREDKKQTLPVIGEDKKQTPLVSDEKKQTPTVSVADNLGCKSSKSVRIHSLTTIKRPSGDISFDKIEDDENLEILRVDSTPTLQNEDIMLPDMGVRGRKRRRIKGKGKKKQKKQTPSGPIGDVIKIASSNSVHVKSSSTDKDGYKLFVIDDDVGGPLPKVIHVQSQSTDKSDEMNEDTGIPSPQRVHVLSPTAEENDDASLESDIDSELRAEQSMPVQPATINESGKAEKKVRSRRSKKKDTTKRKKKKKKIIPFNMFKSPRKKQKKSTKVTSEPVSESWTDINQSPTVDEVREHDKQSLEHRHFLSDTTETSPHYDKSPSTSSDGDKPKKRGKRKV